jgi:O-antigen/teichoic acid export membrane protein
VTLRKDVTRGVFWVAIAQATNQFIAFVVQIILARILVPADFGLVALAYLALNSLNLFAELGFGSALIYRKDRVREASYTAFIMVVAAGLALSLIGVAGAPLASAFFREPRLTAVLRVLSATIFIGSFGQVPISLLTKDMDFRKRFIPMALPGFVSGMVSIPCALSGLGVWSLVAGQVTQAVVTSLSGLLLCDWKPRLQFDRKLAVEMFDYGKHIIGSSLLVFAITNVDNTFVGRVLGKDILGAYNQAYNLANKPATQITRVIGLVMFPAFSKIRDNMPAMKRAFFESARYIALLSMPFSVGMIFFGGDFIYTVYGEKWAAAIVPLQWLAIYGGLRSVAANMGNVFKAGGKPKWLTYIALWRLTTMLLFLYPATKYYGIVGVSILSAVVSVVDFVISATLVNRIIQANALDYLRSLGPIVGVSIVSAGLARLIEMQFHAVPHARVAFITALFLMAVLYAGGIWLVDKEIRERVTRLARAYLPRLRFSLPDERREDE